MMAPLLGMMSDPSELGFVVFILDRVVVSEGDIRHSAGFFRVRMGVGFAITGASLLTPSFLVHH